MTENIHHWDIGSYQCDNYGSAFEKVSAGSDYNHSASFISSSELTSRTPTGTDLNTDKTDEDSIVFERGIPHNLLSSPPQEHVGYTFDLHKQSGYDVNAMDQVTEKLAKCTLQIQLEYL